MSSEGEELAIKQEEYSQTLIELSEEAVNVKTFVIALRHHLQEQFNKEFNDKIGSANRGQLYAQCGTNCQAIMHLLNAIESDIDLINDLSLKPGQSNTQQVAQLL